ncbi:hypothetical protein [Microbacterium sp.]|uniref:hypothetical protein n=1 Tax=Microbacterium sp. TaxID=51671 RepID=UPI002C664F78|nr:hypothetical protein [Microbacterium sp.]HWL78715.1 hypothetical protein [Microbacterium sp.]
MAVRRPKTVRGPAAARRVAVLTTTGIAILGVVTIVLVVLALTQFRQPPTSASEPPPTPIDSASPAASASPTVTAAAPPQPRTVPAPRRIIGAVDAQLAYRANVGGCPDPRGDVAVSSDGGASWAAVDAVGPTDSAAALGFAALNGDYASIVTLSAAACEPQLVQTWVRGAAWEVNNDNLAPTWFLDPRDPANIHTPDGARPTPCPAVALAASADRAAVVCSDERVFASGDRGATWPVSTTIAGVSNIAASGDGFDVAVINQNGCSGVQVLPLDGQLAPGGHGACIEGQFAEGAVALATGGDGELWLWAGDLVARSGDRGATWR